MHAIAHDRTIHVSPDIAASLVGVTAGYRVNLHDLPGWTFHVDAPSADDAQRIAFTLAKREGRARTDAATITKLS
jgi:hypothetical protein